MELISSIIQLTPTKSDRNQQGRAHHMTNFKPSAQAANDLLDSFEPALRLSALAYRRGPGLGARRAFKRAARTAQLTDAQWLVMLAQLLALGSGGAASSQCSAASNKGLCKPAAAASSRSHLSSPAREIGCPRSTQSITYLPTVLPISGTPAAAMAAADLA